MEPHELDNYIGSKLREAGNIPGDAEMNGMSRVWSTIEPQLEKRTSVQWIKMAAVILLLLLPSFFLFLRNREQGMQIRTLNSKLTIIERSYRQKIQAFTANKPDKVVVQHDTIRLIKTVEKKIIPEAVEVVRYVTDTVIIYKQNYSAENMVEPKPAVSPADELSPNWQESPLKTEYILSKDASVKKKKKGRTFQISLGAGNSLPQTEPELAFKTKL
jgi:hypothetical protein